MDGFKHAKRDGYTIFVVMFLTAAVGLIGAAVLNSSINEKRLNVRDALRNEALRTAEFALELAFGEYVDDVETNSGLYLEAIRNPIQEIQLSDRAKELLLDGRVTGIEVRSEFLNARLRRFIDGDDPSNKDDPLKNKVVFESEVKLYAKVNASYGSESMEVYLSKTMAIRDAPLFSHVVFYNDDLLFHRNFDFAGDVHTNGFLETSTHHGDKFLIFPGTVTAVKDHYKHTSVDSYNMGNRLSTGDPRITVDDQFDFANMNTVDRGNVRINGYNLANGDDSRRSDWVEFLQNELDSKLMDRSMAVPEFKPIGTEAASKDNIYTRGVNEMSNSGYSLIEPVLPRGHPAAKNDVVRKQKLASKAGLVLRVEHNLDYSAVRDQRGNITNEHELYVVKGYRRNSSGTMRSVALPDGLIGTANSNLSAVQSGAAHPEPFREVPVSPYSRHGEYVASEIQSGLEDTRTGRGMDLITLDVSRLKNVIESRKRDLDASGQAFRDNFKRNRDWTGTVYVEFPTSLTPDTSAAEDDTNGVKSVPFQYGSAETDIPELARQYQTEAWGHNPVDRTDNIVPIAPELRTLSTSDVGMGLQLINGSELPDYGDNSGLTVATNTSMYVVGDYNADGDLRTGTGLGSSAATSTTDPGHDEVPAALFADSVTLLSNNWSDNRKYSHLGSGNDSRARPAGEPLEVSAAIASADYAAFEFFVRSLENWVSVLGDPEVAGLGHRNPIVVKGALVSFWDAEIPLMKNVYGRNQALPIDRYWNAFASHAFTTARYHQFLQDGRFPPGTPSARFYDLREYDIMYESQDAARLTALGF